MKKAVFLIIFFFSFMIFSPLAAAGESPFAKKRGLLIGWCYLKPREKLWKSKTMKFVILDESSEKNLKLNKDEIMEVVKKYYSLSEGCDFGTPEKNRKLFSELGLPENLEIIKINVVIPEDNCITKGTILNLEDLTLQ